MSKRRPTQWVPLSAYYFDDPALINAGPECELLFVRLIAYAARTPEREGFVTDAEIETRLGFGSGTFSGTFSGASSGTLSGALSGARMLADHGLITPEDGGYRIASWLRWNASRDEALRSKASDRARKSAGTMRQTRSASSSGTLSGTLSGTVSGTLSGALSAGAEGTEGTEGYISGIADAGDTPTPRKRAPKKHTYTPDFEAFWDAYPKKVDKIAAYRAWKTAVTTTDPKHLIDGARRYATDPSRDDAYTKNAATWLRAGSWENRPTATKPSEWDQIPWIGEAK